MNVTKRSLPLDGLRIVAATLVILSHLTENPANGIPRYLGIFFDGDIAVLIFFVLSGYVITNLLVRELTRTGTIAMGQFYFRRALRIWPASYAYIIVATICVALHLASAQPGQIIVASTHLWNYSLTILNDDPLSQGHMMFGHFWSLALEEQFYWTWPMALVLLRKRATGTLALIILIMPLVRIASYVMFPVSRGQLNAMFHTAIDPIAIGAWLSLNEERVKGWLAKLPPWAFYGNIIFLLIACPLLALEMRGLWSITYGRTLEAASAGLLIMALAHGPETTLARLLRTRPMQFGGRISYSLYVWQQLYSLPGSIFPQSGGMAIALSFLTAIAGYTLIERPFLWLRDRSSVARSSALDEATMGATRRKSDNHHRR